MEGGPTADGCQPALSFGDADAEARSRTSIRGCEASCQDQAVWMLHCRQLTCGRDHWSQLLWVMLSMSDTFAATGSS